MSHIRVSPWPRTPQACAALRDLLLRSERRNRRLPKFLMRFLLRSAAKKSRLARAMFGTDAAYLDGMSTYVMKLGPGNLLPPYDTPTDRSFASSPHVAFMRLRTQQVAGLLADRLTAELAAEDARPLHMINIAGGPAIDSLNALILVASNSPGLLDRPIVVHVLDLDDAGPAFGANALIEMKKEGSRLDGLDVDFRHLAYDWNDTSTLQRLLDGLIMQNAVIVASSEGGLFEYGSDDAIVSNLEALHAGGSGARCVVGSVTRADETRRNLTGASQFKIIPRGLERFGPLAQRGGFIVREIRSGMLSDQVQLVPA